MPTAHPPCSACQLGVETLLDRDRMVITCGLHLKCWAPALQRLWVEGGVPTSGKDQDVPEDVAMAIL